LAERVFSPPALVKSPEDIAAPLGIAAPDPSRPSRMVRFLADCLPALLERVPEEHRANPAMLTEWIDRDKSAPDFSRFAFDKAFLKALPPRPGVYVMRNRAGTIIYVGKSRNLKRRVGSYFRSGSQPDLKSTRILDQLHSLEVLPASSEVEALLLEMRMIRDFQPPINLQKAVHEQAASYGREFNLLLLVAEPDADKIQIYLLKNGVFAGRHSVRLNHPAPAALKKKIRTIYFTQRPRRRSVCEPWEKEIVFRWFSANHRRLNYVDVDQAGDCENALRQLDFYLRDPDLLRRKVLYR
jgi:predicted GIY-YIG superfamily endonuclease